MFDQQTSVFDRDESGGAGFFRGRGIFNALLEPKKLCANVDSTLCDRRNVFGTAENVNQIHFFWDIFQAGIRFFAQDFGFVGIYRDDAIAGRLQILGYTKTRTHGIGREANDGNGLGVTKDIGDRVGGANALHLVGEFSWAFDADCYGVVNKEAKSKDYHREHRGHSGNGDIASSIFGCEGGGAMLLHVGDGA